MSDALTAKLKDAPAAFYPRQLMASYPRIVDRIVQLWGSPEIEPYFQELMLTDREGRQGFPQPVLTEILNLRTWYRSLLPPQPRTVDTWTDMIEEDGDSRQTRSANDLEFDPGAAQK
ncbi:hypothetical protein Q9Q94_15735 [Uliginosibacterium sp. 31-16]|uniref:hypothetical protein n=1 Tax=Uliginosibacterium sp. 31-16 TaxID=3068315 RepID=UPI00273DC05A|nr:hypothetical protein [Uliginosibacterium sp. 31-16]MDP5240992.1 hypothetical protein [Uliginosibacterium sp. 31-16]